ncbi:hypothetical protein H2O64_18775 [Kordia sp. YSTF-M3]|uniref:Bacteriocin n=1 Tax=Kordia aestuariivivens TaxID=2759037 RepID=A0ABR7QDV7_9FLAO|nr:hypothetical protein [Kordia aestuariivivens]MBC8756725.1 hypothetical protein [Kordia aestuariivivens]
MKTKNFKSLALNKKSISNLVGGLSSSPAQPSGIPWDPQTMIAVCPTDTLNHTECWCNINRR